MGYLDALVERLPGAFRLKDGRAIADGHTAAANLPTCDATRRGERRFIDGLTTVADRWLVCEKDTADAYAWQEKGKAALDGRYVLIGTDPNADRIYFWDDSAGAVAFLTVGSGLTITTTTLTANDQGLVLVDEEAYSGVTSVSLNSCFPSTYRNYLILINTDSTTGAGDQRLRLRAGGSDTSSGNYELYAMIGSSAAAGFTGTNNTAATSWYLGDTISGNTEFAAAIWVFDPQTARKTRFLAQSSVANSVTPTFTSNLIQGGIRLTTAYDGFTLFSGANNFTGHLRVYGARNA